MPLFKSSNKSQASLNRLTGSRDQSPTQQPGPNPYPHAQAYSGPPPPPTNYPSHQYQSPQQLQHQQHQQQLQPQNPESYYKDVQHPQHPAHLNRSQSSRAGSGVGDPYAQDQQPTVNIVPPTNLSIQPGQPNLYIQNQNQLDPPQSPRQEKEQKRSKRSIIGGLLSSKRDDREEAGDRRSVGRTSSILKKGGPQSPQPSQTSPKVPSSQYSDPRQAGQGDRYSSESGPQEPGQYQAYHESLEQYRQRDQFESPQSQQTRQSVQYLEDSRYQSQHPSQTPTQQGHHGQDRQYLPYQLPHSANSSENNLAYPDPRTSAPNHDPNQALRPPSQTSLGPPSPLVGQPLHDSRPSTSNTQQQRFSTQSQAQQQQQQLSPPPTQHQPPQREQGPISPPPPPQSQQQPQPLQLQQPQPQRHHQQQQSSSLPPSQQPTPQPTPQPQTQSTQQGPSHSQQPSIISNMPRNETSSGRRHDENLYPQQDPRARTQGHEQGTQGRNTPPPTRAREDLSSLDYSQLLAKHEELQAKYSKVKRYYFEREAQVTQLQNTVANQRLSMSKTSLDDAGYTTRFERLGGAIQNLSFNIRKDWRRVPNWLAPVCNRDAHTVGTKEMTAVGRACITRWLYESIFERVFHPGIDPNLSSHLKAIERTLRRGQYGAPITSEQQDDILTKITTWRLTTVEGLQDVLNSRQSQVYTESLVMDLSRQLELYLRAFLNDPPPAGLADSLGAIVGQAISIAQNIPLESRDICIEYFMPGSHISEAYMRIEPGMTVLSHPGSAATASDSLPASNDSEDQLSTSSSQLDQNMNVEEAIRESAKAASAPGQGSSSQRNDSVPSNSSTVPKSSLSTSSKEKKGFLGGLVNKKPSHAAPRNDPEQSKANDNGPPEHTYTLQSLTGGTTDNKIRFAAFLAVEVRGRGVLRETGKDGEKVSSSSKDAEDKKDANATSAGSGAVAGSAAAGTQKSGNVNSATNILCKAPVYAFE